jgi:DNA-binding MarR family transcriptional regulator
MTTADRLWEQLEQMPRAVKLQIPESIVDELGGVTLRAIEYALTSLEERGWIQWHRKSRGGKRRPFFEVTVLQVSIQEVTK